MGVSLEKGGRGLTFAQIHKNGLQYRQETDVSHMYLVFGQCWSVLVRWYAGVFVCVGTGLSVGHFYRLF